MMWILGILGYIVIGAIVGGMFIELLEADEDDHMQIVAISIFLWPLLIALLFIIVLVMMSKTHTKKLVKRLRELLENLDAE